MKLQELLNNYKDKLGWGEYKHIELVKFEGNPSLYSIELHIEGYSIYSHTYSLSDLLFSTPFLSLLEWKKDINPIWVYYEGTKEKMMCHSVHTEFHKINLVLLDTDVERIEYIEKFTL